MGIPDHHLGDAASGGRGLGEMVLGQNGEQFRIDIVASEDSPALHLRAGKGEPQVAAIGPDGKGLCRSSRKRGSLEFQFLRWMASRGQYWRCLKI